jgi:type I restriction enzyme, S subunit
MSDLPESWAVTELAQVARWGSGGTPKKGMAGYYGGQIPWANSGDLADGVLNECPGSITDDGLRHSSAKLIDPHTLLVAMYGATIGKLAIAGVPMATNQAVAFARPERGIDLMYLFFYLLSQRSRLRNDGKGAAQKNISQTILKAWPIPVPPLPEQQRIVAAIEEHFSRLDAAEAGLDRGRVLVRRLTSAQREVEFMDDSVVVPVEDVAADQKHALAIGPFGSNLKVSDYRDNGVPLVFVRDIRRRSFGGEGTRYVDEAKATELSSHIVRAGDVLVTKMGDPPGDVALYNGPDAVITADCIKITPVEGMRAEYLAEALQTVRAQRQIESITKGVAQRKVSLGRFRTDVAVPIPDIAQQQRVVERIGAVAEPSGRLLASIERAQRTSSALRRSVLMAAFSGQLAPQDPSDEPASVLLERIAAGRAAAKQSRTKKKAAT